MTVVIIRSKKKLETLGKDAQEKIQRELLTDEMDEAMQPPDLASIQQRPNAVIKNGGPQLLRGLMIPLCPSANRYWQTLMMIAKGTRFPFVVMSMKTLYKFVRVLNVRSDQSKLYLKTMTEYALQRGFRFHSEKLLRMDVVVCPRNRASIDAHNYTKALLDIFQEIGVYVDDNQVVDLRTRLGPVIKGGKMIISLWEIEHDPDAVMKESWG